MMTCYVDSYGSGGWGRCWGTEVGLTSKEKKRREKGPPWWTSVEPRYVFVGCLVSYFWEERERENMMKSEEQVKGREERT